MAEGTDKSTDKRLANLRPPWKEGESGNPNGLTKGQQNYATIYKNALIKLGKENNKTPDELESELVASGFANARKGNYAFYKDVLDRIHGQATQNHNVGGELRIIKVMEVPNEFILQDNGNKEDIKPNEEA